MRKPGAGRVHERVWFQSGSLREAGAFGLPGDASGVRRFANFALRLRSAGWAASWNDGMPNTALTSTVNPDEPFRLFDITIREAILHQSASEWLTEKERSCFSSKGSPLSASIEAGKRDALLYVILHEATHIVDFCLKLTPTEPVGERLAESTFTNGVWSERTIPAAPYRDPLRERVRFYADGAALPVDQAEAVYLSLANTPFVSLYGASNCADDLAEYAAVYHWTAVIKQPFRIVIRKRGRAVFTYEPMKSPLVRGRIAQMKRFYETERLEGSSSSAQAQRGPVQRRCKYIQLNTAILPFDEPFRSTAS